MPFLKPRGQGLSTFCITVQCNERYLLCNFLAQTSYRSCSKKNDKMSICKKLHFLKFFSRIKAKYNKIMRFTQYIVHVGMRLCKNKNWWMCNIVASIEYSGFLNFCSLTFSQIKIVIKFLKHFEKEGLNFSQITLCEGFSYRKCEMSWLLSCIA